MQSNPYGNLYGGPQAPSQQAHVPWAASPGHAPAQQPGVQAPLPAEPPLPGEPPLPQQPPLANGRTHQVRCIAAFTVLSLTRNPS